MSIKEMLETAYGFDPADMAIMVDTDSSSEVRPWLTVSPAGSCM
jgi:hypothetical protein